MNNLINNEKIYEVDDLNEFTTELSIREIMDAIDENFESTIQKGGNRYHKNWVNFSKNLSTIIKNKVQTAENKKASMPYNYILTYWLNRCQLIDEMYGIKKYIRKKQQKYLAEQGQAIRGIVFEKIEWNKQTTG